VRVRKEFLGRGFGFPFRFDPATGGVATSEYEENIKQCITVILGTKPGERQMLPEFGCRVHELMFAPTTRSTATTIAQMVKSALERWEPRIEVVKVEAWPDPGGTVKVQVHYKIRSTLSEQELSLLLTAGG
jgi:phage baseplate assembly protein W